MSSFFNYLFFAFISSIFLGCGNGGGVDDVLDSGKETTTHRVNLTLKIGFDESILSRDTSSIRDTKRVQFSDLQYILITVFDSQKNYYVDQNISKNSSGNWEFQIYDIPTAVNVTFIAEGFDSKGYRIFSGKVSDQLDISDISIVIPLSLAKTEATILTPSISSIVGTNSTATSKRITFTITNPNSEFVTWKLTPDQALKKYGEFNETAGSLDFRFKSEIQFSINFTGNLNNIIFDNRFDIVNSVGDVTTTYFKLYEQQNLVLISIAPIVNNISLAFKQDRVEATAILDSSVMKKEVCENDFADLIVGFDFKNRTFEDLLIRYFSAIDMGDEVKATVQTLPSDSNMSKLLALDINHSYDGLFKKYQIDYGYSNPNFNNLYKQLTDSNFSVLYNYYLDENQKGKHLPILEIYYRNDANLSQILSDYKLGLSMLPNSSKDLDRFSNLIEYYIANPQSSLLTDYKFDDKNFSKNGEFYYSKFGVDVENNESKARFNLLLNKFKDSAYLDFYKTFTSHGAKLTELLTAYYKNSYVYDESFAPLLNLIIDENFDKLFDDLSNKYSYLSSFNSFSNYVKNSDFNLWLEYYKTQSNSTLNSIKAKLDKDVCTSEDLGGLKYEWSLESGSLPIVDPYANPVTIKNFTGTLQDKLTLVATNEAGVKTEYSYQVNIKSWLDEDGNRIDVNPDTNNSNNSNNNNSTETNNSTDNGSTSGGTTPIIDYKFGLTASQSTDILLLYGETKEIIFTSSKYFNDFVADIVGINNGSGELFDVSFTEISTATVKKYSVKIKANRVMGNGVFTFAVQNSGHAEAKTVKVSIENPIQVLELKRSYTVVEGTEANLTMRVANVRGDSLTFEIFDSSGNYNAFATSSTVFSTGTADGISFNFRVVGLAEGESNVTIRITDTTMDPDYWIEYPVIIKVDKSNEQVLTNKLAQYACGSVQLSSTTYEYTADGWSDSGDNGGVYSSDNQLQIESFNQILSANLSRIVVLHPKGSAYTGTSYSNFYIYNQLTFNNIGTLKYAPTMTGKEFYIKYYDDSTNSVICEKHKF